MKSKAPKRRKPPRLKPTPLETKLVRIGNSRGVRLPKAIIEQAGLTDRVTILLQGGQVILAAARDDEDPRAGWAEQFEAALKELGPDFFEKERAEWANWQTTPNRFDEEDWTW
jgi:antitoxin MazE